VAEPSGFWIGDAFSLKTAMAEKTPLSGEWKHDEIKESVI
jgi:hypothetical protein